VTKKYVVVFFYKTRWRATMDHYPSHKTTKFNPDKLRTVITELQMPYVNNNQQQKGRWETAAGARLRCTLEWDYELTHHHHMPSASR